MVYDAKKELNDRGLEEEDEEKTECRGHELTEKPESMYRRDTEQG